MDLAHAKNLALMGRPESWGGRGGAPLDLVPDGTLRQARAFFLRCIKEEPKGATRPRLEAQVDAINMVLWDREEHNPQVRLAL